MRMFFAQIIESYDEKYPKGYTICTSKRELFTSKGETRVLNVVNVNTRERTNPAKVTGLGYADFKDKEDYENRWTDVINKKLKEVGIKVV